MISFFSGLGLGLSLIVAIGAQNAFILRQAIRREHVLIIVIICAVSDAALILLGVAGLGFLLESAPWLITVARWAGAVFLASYGALAAIRAWRGGGSIDQEADPVADSYATGGVQTRERTRTALAPVVLTTLALTWLNPHVYLDTVIMLGSIAATHGEDRWVFAAGAVIASCVWFGALGLGAGYLGRWLNTPRAWRMLDAAIAVIMISIAVSLVVPVGH